MSYLSGYTGRPPGTREEYQDDFDDDYEAAKEIQAMIDLECEEWDRFNDENDDDGTTEFSENFFTTLWYFTMWNCTYGHLVRNNDENDEEQRGNNNNKEINKKASKIGAQEIEEAKNLNRSNTKRRNKDSNMKSTTIILEQHHQLIKEYYQANNKSMK